MTKPRRATKPQPLPGETGIFDDATLEAIPIHKRVRRRSAHPALNDEDQLRIFGGWTLDKLEVLRLYLKMYRRVAGGGTYIDGFAGEGEVNINGITRPGTALIALQSAAFKQLHFIDANNALTAKLQARLDTTKRSKSRECTVHGGDTNITIDKVLTGVDPNRPLFVCLDQNATELLWTTVERLAGFKQLNIDANRCKAELWILFNQHQVIQRLWPHAPRLERRPNPFGAALDRVFGTREAWIDLWESDAPAINLMRRYCDQLESVLGYQHVLAQEITDPANGRPQYFMIHATDHEAAVDFMRWAKTRYAKDTGRGEQTTLAIE